MAKAVNRIYFTSKFLELPATAKYLYMVLMVSANSNKFVGINSTMLKSIGVSQEDVKILADKHYILLKDDGCVVVDSIPLWEYLADNKPQTNIEEKLSKNTVKEMEQATIENDFVVLYNHYPKKVGRAKGFEYYRQWLKGRNISGKTIKLTNRQMWSAIDKYRKATIDTETQFIKDFSTFMNKAILDYIE